MSQFTAVMLIIGALLFIAVLTIARLILVEERKRRRQMAERDRVRRVRSNAERRINQLTAEGLDDMLAEVERVRRDGSR